MFLGSGEVFAHHPEKRCVQYIIDTLYIVHMTQYSDLLLFSYELYSKDFCCYEHSIPHTGI